MRYEDFKRGMQEMINVYGERSYPDARLEKVFLMVQDLDFQTFKRGLDQLIVDNFTAPMGQKFREVFERHTQVAREKQAKILQERAQQERCQKCDSTGIISAFYRQEMKIKYAFRCTLCNASNILGITRYIAEWNESRLKEFEPEFSLGDHETIPKNYREQIRTLSMNVLKPMPEIDESAE